MERAQDAARWVLALSAMAWALCAFQCAAELAPVTATAQADTLSDTGLCLAPKCYPDTKPPAHP